MGRIHVSKINLKMKYKKKKRKYPDSIDFMGYTFNKVEHKILDVLWKSYPTAGKLSEIAEATDENEFIIKEAMQKLIDIEFVDEYSGRHGYIYQFDQKKYDLIKIARNV